MEDRTRVLGEDNPDTLRTRFNLAYDIGRSGKVPQAVKLYLDLVADLIRDFGPDHRMTLRGASTLAYWTDQAGDHDQARQLFEVQLPKYVQVFGPYDVTTVAIRRRLRSPDAPTPR